MENNSVGPTWPPESSLQKGTMLAELLPGMFNGSHTMVLDFANIPEDNPAACDIRKFFAVCQTRGINPRLPQNRQAFNNKMLAATGSRYLVSQYAEYRRAMLDGTKIAQEGRTLHLGIDIFSKDLEPVYAPCDGEIVEASYEPGFGEYGRYLVFKPAHISDVWIFLGHLSKDLPRLEAVRQGDIIGHLGDYANAENGGWSRHLHLQIMRAYHPGKDTPLGYSTAVDLATNTLLYPDPMLYFSGWQPASSTGLAF